MSQLPNPVQQLLKRAAETPNEPYLHQPVNGVWRSYTWGEVAEQARRMASALIAMGLKPGDAVGLTGMNNAHWFMADFACGLAGLIGVGLYPKQSEDAVRFIAGHAGIKAAFIGPMPDAAGFLGALPAEVVRIALPYPGVAECAQNWDQLIAANKPLATPVERGADEVWSLIYTSGTTGNPKGVIITAANLAFTVAGVLRDQPPVASGEHFLSYLPLAHAFERGAVETASLYLPAQVHFLEELEKLPQTLAMVRPTRFYGVPLVYSRVQGGILKKLPQAKINRLLSIPIVSGFIRRKIRKGLGLDRAWLVISGAAPLPRPIIEWFAKLGIDVLQGYGMTENSIYASLNLPGQNKVGSIGKPYVDAGLRIAEDGEIQCKHPGNTPGYYKDPEKTAELFTADGWLRTGDKGHIDSDGYLFITGRVKEIFKTLKGKYVSPAPIEGKFGTNTAVEQMCLVGTGLYQPMLVLSLNADARKLPREQIEAGLVATMKSVNATLEPHEEICKIVVTKDAWTIDNSLMTPTMKVRRNEIEKRYLELLGKLEADRKTKVYWED
ncbi:AMP-binding protein [Nevskia ramosa]|uniref:AMP-binding protein n=1 Tax=Nevskia ramosa TaxID=64002 RepID=UPI0003B659E4|nr:AMP-binding protein [Nevskia ramosa]